MTSPGPARRRLEDTRHGSQQVHGLAFSSDGKTLIFSNNGQASVYAFEAAIDGTLGATARRLGSWLAKRRRARQPLDPGPGTIIVALAARLAVER